ncbi:hypothetical protein EDC90_101749 [Martelella mediterranea]|uniref:Uncharacterized protein n=2 Tax=Martelella mediterranea TaxID=293089 RepID=A0A4R3NR74_9HYPH|nr:hypothetical protein EDC90_101749 [Martelella mediterranea]
MKRISFLVAALLLLPNAGLADYRPTAEETVAFIIYGVEDGSLLQSGSYIDNTYRSGTVVQSRDIPARFEFPEGLSDIRNVTVEQSKPCVFAVRETSGEGQTSTIEYDFNLFSTLDISGDYRILRFAGSCPVDAGQDCLKSKLLSMDHHATIDRLKMAADFMKREYCDGAPF